MPTIDDAEIARWKERLEDPRYVGSLKKFQKAIYDKFEEHRHRTGDRLIRFVCPRSDIKSLKSIVNKIQRKRKSQSDEEEPYDFEQIEDLVGIKVLCPYPSSAKEVMNWMFTQSRFAVKPTYLFSWDNVTENDSERILRSLSDDFDVGWAKNAEIHKSDDGKTIRIFKDEYSAEIKIDEKKEKATIKISDGRIHDLNVKKENGKLNIYKPPSINDAWTATDKGYRGWHFVAEPSPTLLRLEQNLMGAKCEIQVKTMLQEAWDAQTHDISYKKEELIDKELLDHIKNQSKILEALDEQSEIIRQLIQHVEEEEREHMNIAATNYLKLMGTKFQHYLRDSYDTELPNYNEDCPLSKDKLDKVKEVIVRYRKEKGLNKDLIRFASFIALCQSDTEQEEMAFSLAQELVNANPKDPDAEDVMAGVYWALNRFDEAIRHGKKAINKARDSKKDPTPYEDNFCYWVTEAARARKDVKEEHKRHVLDLTERFSQTYSNNPKYPDTAAFVKIVFGTTKEEIESGLNLTRQAWELAEQSNNEVTQKLAKAFHKRHERLAFFKINQIYQRNKM